VGRYDSEDERGVHLLDVGVHDEATGGGPKDDYLKKSTQFGIRADYKHVTVPAPEVVRIIRLALMS